MRKRILIAVAVIVLILLSFFGFLEYRQYSSYKIPIHNGINTIVKLNADAFIKSFITEYGFNFSKKIKPPAGKKEDADENTGIYIPGNIFIYTLSARQPTTFFCTIPLTQKKDFENFVAKHMSIVFTGDVQHRLGSAYNGKLTILCSPEYAAIAYSEQREETVTILKDILDRKNLAPSSVELIKQIKKDRSHIVYASKDGEAAINFSGNQISMHSIIAKSNGLFIAEQSVRTNAGTDNYATLFLNIKPSASLFSKTYSVKGHTLETDSLLKYFNGYMDMKIPGFVNQTDTITTYEYDDNFEKKEKRITTTIQVPGIEISIGATPSFLNYLEKQGIVTAAQTINREVFPLYQVTVIQKGETLFLNTTGKPAGETKFENTNNFMEAGINVKKLGPILDSTFLKKYVQGVESVSIKGNTSKGTQIAIDGRIQCQAGALKTIVDLVKSFY